MRVALYGRNKKLEDYPSTFQRLSKCFAEHEIQFFATESYHTFLKETYNIDCPPCSLSDLQSGKFDVLISLGGDGTILDTLSLVGESSLPVMGINMGRLGFLANIQKSEAEEAIKSLINNDYTLDKRNLLKVESDNDELNTFPYALNDFVVQKRDTSAMITVKTSLNGEFLNNYWADGLIVSTPTGSSGYNMSCGGPLLFPGSQSVVITPIAAHNLTLRPAVIPDDHILDITLSSRAKNVLVSLDSRSFKISSQTKLTIRKAEFQFNLIQIQGKSYMDTVRNKLLWGKDTRDS